MKEKKLFAGEIIYFYLHNIFSLSFLRRNFSENIFFNVSMNLNSIFLILKTLTFDLKFKKHCQWLILFIKRQIIFFSKKYKKLDILKLLETLIEISVCSDIIVYPLLEDNLKFLLLSSKGKKNLEKFIFSVIFKIVNKKIILRSISNFSQSILSLILTFISICGGELKTDFLNFSEWVISEFLLIISNLHIIYLGQYQLNCILLGGNIFEEIITRVSHRNISFNVFVNILTALSTFYFSNIYPNLYKKVFWNFIGKFENNFFSSIKKMDREIITFLPIFLNFFFFDLKKNFFYLNCSKILFLNFIFLEESLNKIFYFKDFNNLVIFILQNLLSLKNESNLPGRYKIKFFLIEENFNHQKKFFYFNLVLNSMEFKNNGDTIFNPGLADLIDSIFFCNFDLFSKVNAVCTISPLNGNLLKGIFINRYSKEIRQKINQIINFEINKKINREFSLLTDLISKFRYQISIKRLSDTFKMIIKEKLKELEIKPHISTFFERALCIRGNDGIGTILLEFDFFYLEKIINTLNLDIENSSNSKGLVELLSKLFMRITSQTGGGYSNFMVGIKFIHKMLKEIENEICSFRSIVFIMETIFFIFRFTKNISSDLDLYFGNFSYNIIFKNKFENLPYILEIFSDFVIQSENKFLSKLFYKIFLVICNPYVWYNLTLLRPLIKFINSFVETFSNSLSMENIIYVLKILSFVIKNHKQNKIDMLLKSLNIFKILPKHLNFTPHAFEIINLIENEIEIIEKGKIFTFFILICLSRINFSTLKKITNKVKNNSLPFLIDKINENITGFIISRKQFYLLRDIFEDESSFKDPLFRKLVKIIIRIHIAFPWKLENFFQKNFIENRGYSRFNNEEFCLIKLKKIKSFFYYILSRII